MNAQIEFKNVNKKIVSLILMFFFIYSIRISLFPEGINTSRIIFALSTFFILIHIIKIKGLIINQELVKVFVFFSIYFIWVSVRTIISGSYGINYFTGTVSLIIQIFIGSLFLVTLLKKQGVSFLGLIKILQFLIFVQSVFIIVSFLSDSFKEFTIGIIPPSGNIDPMHPFRVRGLMQGTGAGAGAFQSIGLLFSIYIWWKKELTTNSLSYYMYLTISTILTALSILFTGRTGILIVIPIILYLVLYCVFSKKIPIKIIKISLYIPLFIIGTIITIQIIYFLSGGWTTPWGEDGLAQMTRWLKSGFFLSNDSSTNAISALYNNHLFLPDNVFVFLFGDPATFSLERIPSDIGYIRTIFAIGVMGFILAYGSFTYMFYQSIKVLYILKDKLLLLVLWFWLLFIEMKEPFIFDLKFASLYCLITFFVLLDKSNSQWSNKEIKFK